MNRMITKTRPFGGAQGEPNEPNTIFSYDIAGRITEVNDNRSVSEGGGITKYKYDRIGRVIEVNDIYGRTVGYEYDKRGLRTKITYPSSSYYIYEYDGLQRLYKVKISGTLLLATYYYDELSRRTQLKRGGTTVDYQYDIGSQPMKVTNNFSVGGSIVYDYNNYDKVGNRLSMKVNDANAHVYEYDNLYQLTTVDYNNGSQNRYDYDPLGNRTMLSNGNQTIYESNRLNQYTKVNSIDFNYDKNGNLTYDGQYTYIYDCENRLIEVKQGESTIVTYAYNYAGKRIRKTAGATVTQFSYDSDQIIADYNDSGVLLAKYVYGSGIDEPIYLVSGGSSYYYFFDSLGSVVALARNEYAPTEVYSYDVFGEPNRVSSISNRYMFTSREFEPETGLYYYRARSYHPQIGRFIQADPIGYDAGLNMYSYVKNNPTNLLDPYGLYSLIGDCTPKQYMYLSWQAYYHCHANPGHKCTGGMSKSELKKNFGKFQKCVTARNNINNICFRGGDEGHQEAADIATNAMNKCKDLMCP